MFILATTYPYGLRTNDARISGGTAIFDSPGILVWNGADIDYANRHFGVHLTVRSYFDLQNGPSRIFTISRDHYNSNFTIGQMGSHLVIRLRRTEKEFLGMPQFVVEDVFREAGKLVSIEIKMENSLFTVIINDELRLSRNLSSSLFRLWDPTFELALGNEHTWDRPWFGEIQSANVFAGGQVLNVLDDKYLVLAGFWHQLRHKLVFVSDQIDDLIVNLVAMVPFGFLTAPAFQRQHAMRSIALWFLVVLCAEAAQVLIPQRFPAVSDLALNTTGIGIGAVLWTRFNFQRLTPCKQKTSIIGIEAGKKYP